MIDEYGNGRMAVVAEVCEWIEREHGKLLLLRERLEGKEDSLTTHKRASISGGMRTLSHMYDLMKKKKFRKKKYDTHPLPNKRGLGA